MALAEHRAHQHRDAVAGREPAEGVEAGRDMAVAVCVQLLCILAQQPGEGGRDGVTAESLGVLAELVRPGWAEPAEVVEQQRLAIDGPAAARQAAVLEAEPALDEVPVTDVQRRVAQDAGLRGEAGQQVHELLIDEDAGGLLAEAVVFQPPGPPGEDPLRLLAGMHAEEAQIVDACPHHAQVVREVFVLRGMAKMRGQRERRALVQVRKYAVERGEELDIGIEIDHVGMAQADQVLEHERLDRRVHFHHVVTEQESADVGDREILHRHDRALAGIDAAVRRDAVDQAEIDRGVRVERLRAADQDARHAEVVVGADREDREPGRAAGQRRRRQDRFSDQHRFRYICLHAHTFLHETTFSGHCAGLSDEPAECLPRHRAGFA